MYFVVEDGTCIADANAFVTREELLDYADAYYPATTVPDDETTDAAILRASRWLNTYPEWNGEMTCGRGLQGLAWPRTGAEDCAGEDIPDDEVPTEVKQACYLAALAELSSPGVLTPTVTPGKQRRSVTVDVISESYMTPAEQGYSGVMDPTETLRPVLTAISDLLRCLASMPNGSITPWPWVA